MEFSDVGDYCHYDLCGQHTYLPFECTECKHAFCKLHIEQKYHQCPNSSFHNIPPQNIGSKHNAVPYNICAYAKCNKATPISILCKECNQLFCVKHRYIDDHDCSHDISNDATYDDDGYQEIDFKLEENDSDNHVIYGIKHDKSNEYIRSKYCYNKQQSTSFDIEVIDAYKFSPLRKFGYTDKAIYNAWFNLKIKQPSITTNDALFINKMIDILSQHQMEYDHVYEEDQDDDEEEELTDIYANEAPSKEFNVAKVCEMLHDAIGLFSKNKSKQKNVDAFIRLITSTNTEQRQQIKAYYRHKYLMNIDHYIDRNFNGIFKRMLLYSMQTQIERDSYLLRVCIKKTKDIGGIIQILCDLESDMIQPLVEYHDKSIFRKSLQSQIIKLTPNDIELRTFIMNILNGKRQKTVSIASETNDLNKDVLLLTNILKQTHPHKNDGMHLIDIFSTKPFGYLRLLCNAFESRNNISLIDAVQNALGTDGVGYAIHCVLSFCMNKNKFDGDLMTKSMGDCGHKYILFWRIIIERMDNDLYDILQYFNNKTFMKQFINEKFIESSTAILLSRICKF